MQAFAIIFRDQMQTVRNTFLLKRMGRKRRKTNISFCIMHILPFRVNVYK